LGGIKGMSAREQVDKSKAFKLGDFNVLVSTSVCKEGIDVGTCKVGIEHGDLISTTELTQFMGKSLVGCTTTDTAYFELLTAYTLLFP